MLAIQRCHNLVYSANQRANYENDYEEDQIHRAEPLARENKNVGHERNRL